MSATVRGDGDQVLNYVYKSGMNSENMALANAYLHTPGYLHSNITINSPTDNEITITELSAIVEPTNPRNVGELLKMHTTSAFVYPSSGSLTAGVDDFLVVKFTHVPGSDTTSATITTTTSGGITSTDVVVCELQYTGVWAATTAYVLNDTVTAVTPDSITQYKCTIPGTSGGGEPAWDTTFGNPTVDNTVTWVAEAVKDLNLLDYEDSNVTKSMSKPNVFKKFRYDDDGVFSSPDVNDILFQYGANAFSGTTSVVVTFPTGFPTSLDSITCTPEMAGATDWYISASSVTGFTVTFVGSSTGTLNYVAIGK